MINIPLKLISAVVLLSSVSFSQTNEEESVTLSSGFEIESKSSEDRIQFLMELANAYVAEKDYISAISAYERILEIDPSHQSKIVGPFCLARIPVN